MRKRLPRGTLEKLWSDPENWQALGIYYCKDDPRLIVSKRVRGFGWTMNFANPWGWPAVFLMVLSSSPTFYLMTIHKQIAAAVFLSLWIVALLVLCGMMASTDRFED